jgi:hypothetical protein
MGLFGKKKEFSESDEDLMTAKESLHTEMKDLDKLTIGDSSIEIPELPPDLDRLKEVARIEAEKITKDFEEPKNILPQRTEERREVVFSERPLKELNEKIDKELEDIKKRVKNLGSLTKLTIESREIIDLLNLYTRTNDKLNEFVEEINRMYLDSSTSNRNFAAIYKFRACKGLSEMKRELRRIESICKKAGFVPDKIHEILESRAENLIDNFLQKSPKEE